MGTITAPNRSTGIITPTGLLSLANFCHEQGDALSFYFGRANVPDESHREGLIAIKQLVKAAQDNFGPEQPSTSLSQDLDEILATAHDLTTRPTTLKAIFACREQKIWQAFEIPLEQTISVLEVGSRFRLTPLLAALQACAPYCVVILESGKARAFVVGGTQVHELEGELPSEDVGLHADDSRVGWSKHIEGNLAQHERAYFTRLVARLSELMAEQQISRLIVGCREDLWGEIGPQFANFPNQIIGRFHLASFALTPAEVLRLAAPIFDASERQDRISLLKEINESSSRAALGLQDVLYSLAEGRVQKLVLGKLFNQTVAECLDCGHLWAEAGQNCVLCGSTQLRYMAADEGLVRQALITGADLVFAGEDGIAGLGGVAALLRY
jgi:hypothetical protein